MPGSYSYPVDAGYTAAYPLADSYPSWELPPVNTPAGAVGQPVRILSRDTGKCLDVAYASKVNGGYIHQWDYTGVPNQQWLLEPVDATWYRIVSVDSGKCLEVQGASLDNGARIDQSDFTGQPNQLWQPVPVGDGLYKIINQNSGKCLDVAYASKVNGGYIHQWDYTGVPNQQWLVQPVN